MGEHREGKQTMERMVVCEGDGTWDGGTARGGWGAQTREGRSEPHQKAPVCTRWEIVVGGTTVFAALKDLL